MLQYLLRMLVDSREAVIIGIEVQRAFAIEVEGSLLFAEAKEG